MDVTEVGTVEKKVMHFSSTLDLNGSAGEPLDHRVEDILFDELDGLTELEVSKLEGFFEEAAKKKNWRFHSVASFKQHLVMFGLRFYDAKDWKTVRDYFRTPENGGVVDHKRFYEFIVRYRRDQEEGELVGGKEDHEDDVLQLDPLRALGDLLAKTSKRDSFDTEIADPFWLKQRKVGGKGNAGKPTRPKTPMVAKRSAEKQRQREEEAAAAEEEARRLFRAGKYKKPNFARDLPNLNLLPSKPGIPEPIQSFEEGRNLLKSKSAEGLAPPNKYLLKQMKRNLSTLQKEVPKYLLDEKRQHPPQKITAKQLLLKNQQQQNQKVTPKNSGSTKEEKSLEMLPNRDCEREEAMETYKQGRQYIQTKIQESSKQFKQVAISTTPTRNKKSNQLLAYKAPVFGVKPNNVCY